MVFLTNHRTMMFHTLLLSSQRRTINIRIVDPPFCHGWLSNHQTKPVVYSITLKHITWEIFRSFFWNITREIFRSFFWTGKKVDPPPDWKMYQRISAADVIPLFHSFHPWDVLGQWPDFWSWEFAKTLPWRIEICPNPRVPRSTHWYSWLENPKTRGSQWVNFSSN